MKGVRFFRVFATPDAKRAREHPSDVGAILVGRNRSHLWFECVIGREGQESPFFVTGRDGAWYVTYCRGMSEVEARKACPELFTYLLSPELAHATP